MAWVIIDDKITNTDFIELPEKAMTKPYPKALWRCDPTVNDGLPYHALLPRASPTGAFMNAKNLKYVSIPQSVKLIGEWAFTYTALKKVKIAPDCEYFPTSFPEDCIIEFYGGEIPLPNDFADDIAELKNTQQTLVSDLQSQITALTEKIAELEEKLSDESAQL